MRLRAFFRFILPLFLLALTYSPRAASHRRRARARARAVSPAPAPPQAPPCLVWTHLYGSENAGSLNFQYYILESIRQARIWNPGVPFFLLTDSPSALHRERPHWRLLLSLPHLNATIVDVSTLRDWQLIHLETRMRDIWGPLAHAIGTSMQPSLGGGTNTAFTVVTLTRLIYVHHWLRATGQRRAIHLENDQMVYGGAGELAAAAGACGVRAAVGHVAAGRVAAAVVYVEGAPALAPFLDFLWGALSHGWQHAAAAVGGDLWVTDMALLAAWARRAGGGGGVALWPLFGGEGGGAPGGGAASACLAREMGGLVVDAAAVGIWFAGDMGRGRQWFEVRTEFSDVAVWDAPNTGWGTRAPFEAGGAAPPAVRYPPPRRAPAAGAAAAAAAAAGKGWLTVEGGEAGGDVRDGPPRVLRYPVFNSSRAWNLHIHSKMLHWWRSDDPAPPTDVEAGGEGGDMC